MRPRICRLLVTYSWLALVGCRAGWYQPAEPVPAAFKPRQRIQVWREGRPLILHAVRIGRDSITGVPERFPPSCDSCRVAVPRIGVDSLRIGGTDDDTIAALGGGGLLVGVALWVLWAGHAD